MAAIVRANAMKMTHDANVRGAPPKESKGEEMKRKAEAQRQVEEAYETARPVAEDYEGWRRSYVEFGDKCHAIAGSAEMESFILSVIGLACLMIGVQTYSGMNSDENAVTRVIDFIILAIFGSECVLKILAESIRPWMYIHASNPLWKWNLFDIIVVVLCLPVLPLGNSAAALRLLRLLRLAKLVEKIPKLRALIAGLIGGMEEIMYISILIMLIFYLYAILGIELFRANDPWHFRNFFFTMVTLFRMATLEDWSDIFYINYYGCASFSNGGLYIGEAGATTCEVAGCEEHGVGYATKSLDVKWAMDAAVLNQNPLVRNATNVNAECCFPIEQFCTPNQTVSPVVTVLYFVSYITISALVMLSMFVGAISISMSESVKAINEERVEADKAKRALKAEKIQKTARQGVEESAGGAVAISKESLKLPLNELNQRRRMGAILKSAWDGKQHTFVAIKECTWVRQRFSSLTKACRRLTHSPKFQNGIIGIIIITGIMVGLATSKALSADAGYTAFSNFWNDFITVVFTVEAALKILAEGFEPWRYLYVKGKGFVGWNVFDFSIVIGTWLPGSGSLVMILRLLRLLLVLKLVKSFPQLRLAVEALIGGIAAMGYIGLMLFVVFYFFAIFGGIIFSENDPWHFQNLHTSIITLFRMATMEDWTDVMYINYFGCNVYGYSPGDGMTCDPEKSTAYGYLSVLYAVSFIVIGSLVMLNLFIGVITTSMEATMADMEEEAALDRKVDMMVGRYRLSKKTVKLYKEVFSMLDLDGGGDLSATELKIGLNAAGLFPADSELQRMMNHVDPDGSGVVDFAEFVQFLAEVNEGAAGADPNKKTRRLSDLVGHADDQQGEKHVDASVNELRAELKEKDAILARQSNTLQALRKELQQARAQLANGGHVGGAEMSGSIGNHDSAVADSVDTDAARGSVSLRQLSQREVWDQFVQNNGSKVLV